MTYSTLMVHMELGRWNAAMLQAALDFAQRFDSEVVGIAGCLPMHMYYPQGYVGDLGEQEQKGFDGPAVEFLAHEARAADLILTGVFRGDAFDSSRSVNTGNLVLQVGRPVLVVPLAARELHLDQVLVARKEYSLVSH